MYRSRKKKFTPATNEPKPVEEKKLPPSIKQSEPAGHVLFGVVVVSLLSIPICYFLSYLPQMKDSSNVFLYSVVICVSVAPLTYFLLIKHLLHMRKEFFFYVFTIFAFTGMADLLLALTINEYSSAFHFYLEQGEVYLKTAHGMFINYWDGTTHYTLYLIMLFCMLKKKTQTKFYRYLSLFWCGSILNSLIVLVGGAAVGRYGSHIKSSCLLNVPYALFPLIFALQQFRSRSDFINDRLKGKSKAKRARSLTLKCFDVGFLLYLVFAIAFAIYRAFHVLRIPLMKQSVYYDYEPYMSNTSGFPLVQLLTYAFYFVPFYGAALRALLFYDREPQQYRWFPDWAMIHAGAAAQAQFSYFASSLHNPPLYPDSTWSPIPSQYFSITSTLNILLFIVPQLLAFRICWSDNDLDFY